MVKTLIRACRCLGRQAFIASCSAVAAFAPGPASAQAVAQQMTQVPGYYRMALGQMEVTALFDGQVALNPAILKGAPEKDIQNLLKKMFVPVSAEGVQTAVNAFLVNTGSKLILVDAGAADCFGPTLGAVSDNIRSAGYDAKDVDTVLLTHLHGDHACGLTARDGSAAFPNAVVYVAKQETGFWLNQDIAAQAPPPMQPFFVQAQAALAPYMQAGKLKKFEAGDSLFPGVTSLALPGHTPGHAGFQFQSAGQQLLIWGDVVHSHSVQFGRPEVSIDFDVDQSQAVATRKKIFAQASQEQTWIAGAHLPFPGLGHIRIEDTGYAWVPIEYAPLSGAAASGSKAHKE